MIIFPWLMLFVKRGIKAYIDRYISYYIIQVHQWLYSVFNSYIFQYICYEENV